MPKIRSSAEIAQKWGSVTPQRAAEYEQGVKNPKENWFEKTKAAAPVQAKAIQEAIAKGRFLSGVEKAGQAKWQEKTVSKGVTRWGPGVELGKGDYQAGFAPYRDTIEATILPQRYPAGDPRNIERVRTMAQALRRTKVGG